MHARDFTWKGKKKKSDLNFKTVYLKIGQILDIFVTKIGPIQDIFVNNIGQKQGIFVNKI